MAPSIYLEGNVFLDFVIKSFFITFYFTCVHQIKLQKHVANENSIYFYHVDCGDEVARCTYIYIIIYLFNFEILRQRHTEEMG